MKIETQKTNTKQNVFWDVDDVVLSSSEAIVSIINETELKPRGLPTKEYTDCKDWNYRSVWRGMTNKRTLELFNSDEFWAIVKIRQEFYNMLDNGLLDNYNNIFVTKGSEINLQKKKAYLEEHLLNRKNKSLKYQFIGMPEHESKGKIDMEDGIQIDDVFNNLICTNARIKVLMQNGIETRQNNALLMKPSLNDTIYNINYLNQMEEILKFNLIEKL